MCSALFYLNCGVYYVRFNDHRDVIDLSSCKPLLYLLVMLLYDDRLTTEQHYTWISLTQTAMNHNIDQKIVRICNHNTDDFEVYSKADPHLTNTSATIITQRLKSVHKSTRNY